MAGIVLEGLLIFTFQYFLSNVDLYIRAKVPFNPMLICYINPKYVEKKTLNLWQK